MTHSAIRICSWPLILRMLLPRSRKLAAVSPQWIHAEVDSSPAPSTSVARSWRTTRFLMAPLCRPLVVVHGIFHTNTEMLGLPANIYLENNLTGKCKYDVWIVVIEVDRTKY